MVRQHSKDIWEAGALDFLGLINNTLPSAGETGESIHHWHQAPDKCHLAAFHGPFKASGHASQASNPFSTRKHAAVDLSMTEGFPGHPPPTPFLLTPSWIVPLFCLAQSVHLQPQRKG